jgi:hypothetical protein
VEMFTYKEQSVLCGGVFTGVLSGTAEIYVLGLRFS